MICDVYIIRTFNEFLKKCHTAFDLSCIYLPTHWDIISDFIKRNVDTNHCHDVSQDSAGTFAILATEKDSEYKDIVSYISFDSNTGIKTGKKHLVIQFSCTDKKYENRGLSTLLTLFIITYAIDNMYTDVLCVANNFFSKLLKSKFGFEVNPDVFEEEVLDNPENLLINTRLILDSKLDTYKDTYIKLSTCSIIK